MSAAAEQRPAPAHPVTFDELTAAATVGLAGRPLPALTLPGPAGAHTDVLATDDPAVALLDAVALLTAARRGGALPRTGIELPEPPALDGRPVLPVSVHPDVRDVLARGDAALLGDLLVTAAARGYLAPAPLLPALLDAAVRDRDLRAPLSAVLGERGRWLAAQRQDWAAIAARSEVAAEEGDVWETGRLEERRRYLEALRQVSPDAARDLLAAGWEREPGEARETFLPVLAAGLSARDEPFLEAVLDDRKASVRAAARALLTRLPRSLYLSRAAARAQGLLRVERKALRRRILVTLPAGDDADATRDGVEARAARSAAHLLARLLAAAPLAQWPRLLGADPATLVGLPVDGGFAVEVHAGWRAAAVRQADAVWARALLAAGPAPDLTKRPVEAWTTDAELAAVLPLPERLDRVLALLRAEPLPQTAVVEVGRLPAPWPDVLARAVVAHLSRVSRSGRRSPADSLLLDAAARRLPTSREPDWVAELTVIAGLAVPESWSARVLSATDTLGVRRHFEETIR